jgi:phenylpropionate dioxygenase-like ring-hydroxylating dioxygenase large terminal subunit
MFLSHANFLREGQHVPLAQFNREKVLTKTSDGYKVVSNVCPHQQSIITTELSSGNRTCPYHNWTFDVDGNPVTSGRTSSYCKNTNPLSQQDAYQWNSLIFSEPMDFPYTLELDTLMLVEQRIDLVEASAETIMDLFLDVDHIPTVHKGVYDQIGIDRVDNIRWSFYPNGSVQQVPQGAVWISRYPNTMIEWQQGSLFVTVAQDAGPKQSKVHVFKYRDVNSSESDWKLNENVWETAWQQDKQQSELIVGRTTENLEMSKLHFRNWQNGSNL